MASLREALEEGYDQIDSATSTEPAPVETTTTTEPAEAAPVEASTTTDTPPETAEQKAERARDEAGRFTKEKPAAKAEPTKATTSSPPAAGKTTGTAVPQTAKASVTPSPVAPVSTSSTSTRPPAYWKATERELWAKTPPEVQSLINRYDREREIALQRAREDAKGSSTWIETVRPYEAQIRQSGQDPVKYVGSLLQTAHSLSYGAPEDRARVLADIVASFNVPPVLLDQALVARMQGGQMPQQPQQQFRDPRLDQLLAQAQQRKAEAEHEAMSEAEQTASSFGEAHEFYGDVADSMADILMVWANQGKKTATDADLERAYTLACNMNPDVSSVLEQRKAAEAVKAQAEATARARQASSSVKTQPTSGAASSPQGLRAALEKRADELGIS